MGLTTRWGEEEKEATKEAKSAEWEAEEVMKWGGI